MGTKPERTPLGVFPRKGHAVKLLLPAGRLLAAALLAVCALTTPTSLAVAKEPAPAFSLEKFITAAGRGDVVAMRNVGLIYVFGYGVDVNKREGARWLRLAADKGDAKAQYHLAWLYRLGEGVPLNFAEALKWEKKAAAQGYLEAMVSLGKVYQKDQNYAEAHRWFKAAAARGDLEAEGQLVMLYTTGILCNCDLGGIDFTEGLRWLIRKADAGSASAQWGLGLIYEEARHDDSAAYVWYMLAAAQGHKDAETRAFDVSRRLTAAQQAQATQEIKRRWKRIAPYLKQAPAGNE